jgi:hypothetical protein
MNEAKHTPGPWEQMDDGGPSRFVFTGGHAPEHPSHCIQAASVADARLIAAAPELLEFVRELASGRNATTRDLPPSIRRDAAALLAKATGTE